MSDSSSLFGTLLGPLRQPSWIAAIASVGIHGLLGASTPIFTLFSKPANTRSPVQLVQLSPEQLGNLPSTLTPRTPPKFNLSPIPAPPLSLPSLPPEPPQIALPPLPPPLPSTNLPPWPSTSPTATAPPVRPAPRPPVPPSRPNPPSSDRPPVSVTPTPTATPTPDSLRGEPLDPPVDRRRGWLGEGLEGDRANLPENRDNLPDFSGQDVETPDINYGRRTPGPDLNQGGPTPDPNGSSTPPASGSEQLAANEGYSQKYAEMFNRFKSSYPDLEGSRVIRLARNYPDKTCATKPEMTRQVVIGIVIKPDGQPQATPEVLAPIGSPELESAAKEAAASYPFERTSNHKLYPLAVEFTCSAVPPVTPAPTPTPPVPGSTPPSSTPTPPASRGTPPSSTPTPPASRSTPPSSTPTPSGPKPSPSPTSPTPETTPSPGVSPQPSTSPSPTSSPEPTPTPSPTASPEPTPTPSPTTSPEPTPTTSPTTSPEPTPTTSPTASPEPTPTTSPTASPEPTPTTSPTASPEPTPTTSPTTSETPSQGQ